MGVQSDLLEQDEVALELSQRGRRASLPSLGLGERGETEGVVIVAPETRQTLRGERVEGLLADRKGQMGVETRSAARRLNGALDRLALLAQGLASPLVALLPTAGYIFSRMTTSFYIC